MTAQSQTPESGRKSKRKSTPKKRRRGRPPNGTEDWTPKFIGAIMEGAHVRKAARLAGVDPCMPYMRRARDEEFKRVWQEASDIGTEFLEQEAARRAFHGTIKPVFHKGTKCGHVNEYSDTLMIFLLKARNPAKYRDVPSSVTVKNDVKVINVFSDIEDDVRILTLDAETISRIPQDGSPESVDATQADGTEAASKTD